MPELVITTEQLDAALLEVLDRLPSVWRECKLKPFDSGCKREWKPRDALLAHSMLREELTRIFYSKLRLPIP